MWQDAEKFLLKDKFITSLVKKWGHCKIKRSSKSKYFIDLTEAIVSQQLSGKAASTIFGRFRVLCDGNINPDIILKLSEVKLRSVGLSFAKIRYIKDLAGRVKSGGLELNKLDKMMDEDVITKLVEVKGIGRWTAEMFLMFSLGRPDVFPIDDLGIRKGFEKVIGTRMEGEKLAKFAEKNWKPYRTIASWYLWRSLENR